MKHDEIIPVRICGRTYPTAARDALVEIRADWTLGPITRAIANQYGIPEEYVDQFVIFCQENPTR